MIVLTPQDMHELQSFIAQTEVLAYDIETTGLSVHKDSIIGFGISDSTRSFYVPTWTYSAETDSLSPTTWSKTRVVALLQSLASKKLVTFNASFDLRFTKNYYGVDLLPALYCDVLLLKHSTIEDFPLDLKGIATSVFGLDAKAEQIAMKESIRQNGGTSTEYYKADMHLMAKYCEMDCLLTMRLMNHYLPILRKQGLEQFYFTDEVLPLYKTVTIPMEQRGIMLDMKLLQESKTSIDIDIAILEASIQASIKPYLSLFTDWFLAKDYPVKQRGRLDKQLKAGLSLFDARMTLWRQDAESPYMFNLSSKHHLKKLFFDTLGETPLSRTPTGQPQVNEDFIDAISAKYEWAEKLRVYNKLSKINGSYLERFLAENIDGVFYPSFQQHRTVSGRYGSDLQQLSRPLEPGSEHELVVKHTNVLRKLFIARPGHKFIDADYESLEPHVFAHVSGDERLKNIFRQGHDFYSTIAIMTEGLKDVSADKSVPNYLGKISPAKRQKAKAYCLGVPYGMSGYKLAFELNIDKLDAEELVQNYLNAFPELKSWIERSHALVVANGQIRAESGRIRHMMQAKRLYDQHGANLLDSLWLWKQYHDHPIKYEKMKEARRELKNYLNNGCNFQIQSLSASIVNRAAIAINKQLKAQGIPGLVVCQVHDQLIVEVPEQYSELTKQLVSSIMESTYKLSIALKAPAAIGSNFYDAH